MSSESAEEVHRAYVQYQISKSKYLNEKVKRGGGILNIQPPRDFSGDWTISGPVSFYIYKKHDKIIYLFGDVHHSWENTCSRSNAKPATSLLTYNANCIAKGNCITIQQLIERVGEVAKSNKETVNVYYEDSLENLYASSSAYKIAIENLTKHTEYLKGPLDELLLCAWKCITNKTCNAFKMYPSDIRHTNKFVITFKAFIDHLGKLLTSSSYNDGNVTSSDTDNLLDFFMKNMELSEFFIGISSKDNAEILLEIILKSEPEIVAIYNNFDADTKLNFNKAIQQSLKDFNKYYELSELQKLLSIMKIIMNWYLEEKKINIDDVTAQLKAFQLIKDAFKEIPLYKFMGLFAAEPFMDAYVITNIEFTKNNNNIIYAGNDHIITYANFFKDNGYKQILKRTTETQSRCQPMSIDYQKVINFDV
jgi:hypothetical protein